MKRYSRKREAILAVLRGTDAHPTAEWVYHRLKPEFPDLSLATVYRNLGEFLASGELRSVAVVDSAERFDADVTPHSHFICEKCGAVLDVALPDGFSPEREAERFIRGRVHSLTFHGLCQACLEKDTQA